MDEDKDDGGWRVEGGEWRIRMWRMEDEEDGG